MKRYFYLFLTLVLFSIGASAQTAADREPNTTASPAPAQKKSRIFRPNKDQITQVQTKLKAANLYSGEATGKLSDPTRASIKAWQGTNGLKKTGTLNRATLEKMSVDLTDTQKAIPVDPNSFATAEDDKKPEQAAKASTAKPTAAGSTNGPKRPAPFRASSDQIKAAQKVLRDGKMLTGGEDGKLDDTTRDGLGKYQEANSLKVTKTLNASTLGKMGITLTDKQKEQVAAQAAYDAARSAN
ncbi:MAG: peptidoglycan-binding domain-containing protein [bacterium]|nr:peptidoglycan-binding domain-containing protein [bacterium]